MRPGPSKPCYRLPLASCATLTGHLVTDINVNRGSLRVRSISPVDLSSVAGDSITTRTVGGDLHLSQRPIHIAGTY